MKIGEHGVNPYHTEYTGTHDYNDGRSETPADTAAGCNGAIHESAEGIGKTHNLRALESCYNDGFLVGKQG